MIIVEVKNDRHQASSSTPTASRPAFPQYYACVIINWGSVPDWFAGVGALVALTFAGVAARSALRTNEQQSRQLAQLERAEVERAEDRRRAQAAKVASWIVLAPGSEPEVWCMNSSGLPVYNLIIWCHTAAGVATTVYAVKMPDTAPKKMNVATNDLTAFVITAARNTELLNSLNPVSYAMVHPNPDWGAMYREGILRVSIQFLDAEGRWWLRNRMGQLMETETDGESNNHGYGRSAHA